jgi:hypothetical protein
LLNVTFFVHKKLLSEKTLIKKVKQANRLIAAANLPALYEKHSTEIAGCTEKIKKNENKAGYLFERIFATATIVRQIKPKKHNPIIGSSK